jgi:hypothetical protein
LAKTRLPLNSNGIIYSLSLLHKNSQWYDPSLIFILPSCEKDAQGLSKSPFLAINAKGGENIKPKAKGLHQHHHFKKFRNEVLIGIFQVVFISIVVFSN